MSCYKILLDKVIDEEVEKLPLSNANKNHSKRFIKMLIKDGRSQNGDPFSFTDKPYNYLSKGFGNNYKKSFLDVLISEKLVEVDNLYVMIREEDIFCLTKHDSLIVKSCDEFKVRNIIEEYFKNIEFKATIR